MIPQAFPKATVDEDRAEIDTALARVLDSGFYILGPEVDAFEQAFAAWCGLPHAVGVSNGTDALRVALLALDIGPGDLVAVVSHTAVATVAAIRAVGARPLWVDVDPATCLMDLDDLEARLAALAGQPEDTAALKAVVVVHLYGAMVPMDRLMALARRHGLRVIEDCAQAHGATWDGRRAGGFGDVAAFSFYPTKNLGAPGDAGAVVTADPALAERLVALRQYGWRERFVSSEVGVNARLDPIQAAILGVMLPKLATRNEARRTLAAVYDTDLADCPGLTRPAHPQGCVPVYHQYVVQLDKREALMAHLRDQGVGTAIHYPVPVHRQPAHASAGVDAGLPLPRTEALASRILSLPMYPQLAPTEAARVARLVRAFQEEAGTVA